MRGWWIRGPRVTLCLSANLQTFFARFDNSWPGSLRRASRELPRYGDPGCDRVALSQLSARNREDQRVDLRPAHQSEHRHVLRLGRGLLLGDSRPVTCGDRGVLCRVAVRAEQDCAESAHRRLREQRLSSRCQGTQEPSPRPRLAAAHRLSHADGRAGVSDFFLYSNSRAAIFLLMYTLIVLTTVLLYVLACDPLPPCPGRVREWLRGWAAAPASSPESRG